jgi:hypothetical protein
MYADMQCLKEHFDTSNYPPSHPNHSLENKAVLGKFKDEVAGDIITSFVALKPKMYSLQIQGKKDEMRAKGIKKSFVQRNLRHELYLKCLNEKSRTKAAFNLIRSRKHQLHTIRVNKTALCAFDSKRYILEDGVQTLPHGHYKITPQTPC